MPQFLTGDELGNVKALRCLQKEGGEWEIDQRILHAPLLGTRPEPGHVDVEQVKANAIHQLALGSSLQMPLLAAARNNGTVSVFEWKAEESSMRPVVEWKDTRFKSTHSFVGLDVSKQGIFWCTSNGSLGFVRVDCDSELPSLSTSQYQKISLPTRLCAWRLGPGGNSFTYGGNEVGLAVWDTEEALRAACNSHNASTETSVENAEGKKRKRAQGLLPGEIWRAKNLPNDELNLRRPINITSLSYIQSPADDVPKSVNHIVTGTEQGDVRRYDIRAARRPIANWCGIAKSGGVGIVQSGISEHELFVADRGSDLSAVDLRTGRVMYSYRKLQGAVTSLALAPAPGSFLASAARDRFFRFHSTAPPSEATPRRQDSRGNVLSSIYTKSAATAVVFDSLQAGKEKPRKVDDDEDIDDVWETIPNAEDSDDDAKNKKAKHYI